MKSNMMRYKGYRASISYDSEDRIFVGEVFGIKDFLNFHGRSIEELENAFHDCIENYLSICKEIGKNPEKEFSGTFNIRIAPVLHEKAAEYAASNSITLNQVVSMAIESYLRKQLKA
ncbi:MAG: type II toxin-antitoxin system HicB family antitoxin [Erysipelotrichaceae bacterium]|nr:type II toxin-antitoxin system HicB family antitoxin [Erysipelotrichaceae bacterium]